jgi:hypothetical protein
LAKEFNAERLAFEHKNSFIGGRFHGILLESARQ